MEIIDMEFDGNATYAPPETPRMANPKTAFKPNFRRVEHSADPPPAAASEYGERLRVPDMIADVAVPLAQVAIVGVLSLIVWLFVLPHIEQPRIYAIPIAAMTMLAQWFATIKEERHSNPVVERVERSAEQPAASPAAAPTVTEEPMRRIAVTENYDNGAHKRTRLIDLPQKIDSKMPNVARLIIVLDVPFSRTALSDQHRALSQNEYRKLAKTMIDAGLAIRPNRTTTDLTGAGRSFLRGYLDEK